MDNDTATNIIDLSRNLLQKETEIELLQQTFTEIGSELDLDKVFQIVSERARELISADTLLIPLLDDNCTTYTYRGGSGVNSEEIIGEALPIEFGVCGWVWKLKRPWWQGMLNELSHEERNRWEKEVGNMILVPLQGKRHFLGGIAGLNKTGGGSFDKKDLNLLQLFASIVSVAIENAMAVKGMEVSHKLNEDYRHRLEIVNKQLVESSKELEYLSLFDSVTALPNRTLLYDRLNREISEVERLGSTVGILLIDIDSFKDFNDALGHDRGDDLLNKIARRFEENIGNVDTLARLGGDEFVVILPGQNLSQVEQRAEQFIREMKNEFIIGQQNIIVSASIGVAIYPKHGDTISQLLSHADLAMHEAKSSKLDVCVYNPDNDHSAKSLLAMIADIRNSLDKKQFRLHYQPKVDAETGQVVAVEALGRWTSKRHGEVPPNIFIRVLEDNGLINEYTYWAIETALFQAKEWEEKFGAMRVAVNLSPQTLMHPGFKENIDRIIKTNEDGRLLTFEITENLFLSEFDRLANVLQHVCALDVELSIDDYGTGYSSLSRLRRLPVTELKIDQSFVKAMADNKDDQAVVHSTIELAHNLGLTVVAEGVETQSALDLLVSLGCDVVQGFLVSKPLALDEFEAFIDTKHKQSA